MRIKSALALLALDVVAHAADPISASGACPASDAPGRVRCTAEVKPPGGSRIEWADVVIVSAPAFITPLKGRIAPSDATDAKPDLWRFAFAIVAKQRGKGEMVLRVRAVVCEKDACRPEEREVRAPVQIGD